MIGADGDRELANGGEPASEDGAVPALPADPNACPPDQKRCDGACVPKSVDYGCGAAECSPCSVPNAGTIVCKDGKCAAGTCKAGFGACGAPSEGCQSDLTSPLTCTGCLTACKVEAGQVCTPSGCGADCGALTNCGGACVDTKVAPSHCGRCGNKCAAAQNGDAECKDGACVVTCRQGYGHCDGNLAGPCVALQVFYRDADGDGVGAVGQTKQACNQADAGAGWVAAAGDCHDGNPQVFPGQQTYFSASYTNLAGLPSFDYDCNGVEAESGTVRKWTSCSGACAAAGLAKASPLRGGAGVNDYCGSTRYVTCELVGGVIPVAPLPLLPNGGGQTCTSSAETVPANPCR